MAGTSAEIIMKGQAHSNYLECAPQQGQGAGAPVSFVDGNGAFNGNIVIPPGGSITFSDGTITTAGGQISVVNITAAQIIAATATPITLVPAQGNGTIVWVTDCFYEYVSGGTPFTNTASAAFGLFLGASSVYSESIDISALSGTTNNISSIGSWTQQASGESGDASATLLNQPVTIKNTSAAVSGGNGTITVVTHYFVAKGL